MKRIRMLTSLAGDAFSFSPDQVLTVGVDVTEEMATALCTDPPDAPRAEWIDESDVLVDPETDPAESSEPVVYPWGSQEYFDRFDATEEDELVEEIGEWGTETDGASVLTPPIEFIGELIEHEAVRGGREAVVEALQAHLQPADPGEPEGGEEPEGGTNGEPENGTDGEPESEEEPVKDETPQPETATAPVDESRETATVERKPAARKRAPKKATTKKAEGK